MRSILQRFRQLSVLFTLSFIFLANPHSAIAQNYPQPKSGIWSIKNFKFNSGETLDELKIAYTTIGDPSGEPVLILHGTTGSAQSFLKPSFAGELFGPGQPLDASKYYIILPDSIGTGHSSKPSDGLRMSFPHYDYMDIIDAEYRTVYEGLGVKHLRLLIGNSMGGMQAWLWGIHYPEYMDILVPMASTPTQISGRNWMLRRMLIESIKRDPEWMGGQYTAQPKGAKTASLFFSLATNGGTLALQEKGNTRMKADAYVDKQLSEIQIADANDLIYQWDSARHFNPSNDLERIKATVLAINSEDDERNPVSLGLMQREIRRIPNATFYLIPESASTSGHSTVSSARLWKDQLDAVLRKSPASR